MANSISICGKDERFILNNVSMNTSMILDNSSMENFSACLMAVFNCSALNSCLINFDKSLLTLIKRSFLE